WLHTANALPNPGNEMWHITSDRPGAAGVASNTRWYVRRSNPGFTVVQEYIIIDDTGAVHIADNFVFSTGGPSPGLSGAVNLGGHILSSNAAGTTPTLGALQTGISSQSITGQDTHATFTVTTTASPPGTGATIAIMNYGKAYGVAPRVFTMNTSGVF